MYHIVTVRLTKTEKNAFIKACNKNNPNHLRKIITGEVMRQLLSAACKVPSAFLKTASGIDLPYIPDNDKATFSYRIMPYEHNALCDLLLILNGTTDRRYNNSSLSRTLMVMYVNGLIEMPSASAL